MDEFYFLANEIIESYLGEFSYITEANNRSRAIKKQQAKLDSRKVRIVDYDGTKKGWLTGVKKVASQSQMRRVYRDMKKNPSDYTNRAFGRRNSTLHPDSGIISVNTKNVTSEKARGTAIRHEGEHHKQALVARDLGGMQNVRRMNANYKNQVTDSRGRTSTTKYVNHPLERNANDTAATGVENPTTRSQSVRSTIGYKRAKNATPKLKYTDGMQKYMDAH